MQLTKCCIFSLLAVVALLSPFPGGCSELKPAPILPGNDPLVVNAERLAQASLSTYESLVDYDSRNLDFMKQKLPAVHETVQGLRREFPPLYRSFREATKSYKASKSAEDADNLNLLLRQVQSKGIAAQEALSTATKAKAAETSS